MSPAKGAQWRRDRRAALRAHHPDLGGDADSLRAALAEVDRRHTPTPAPRSRRRRARRLVRALRGRLPRGWPGARRYLDL
ncbi:hypothetical protein [Janibacter melonis]|uniref:hypothetical protein n=1 Tax=Janibacter melonis TaxID=262209 RepID=UPI00174C4977|nr:hypothetical protein [Janibacter melonis]